MGYKILCWIPVDEEELDIIETMEEAEQELNQAELMQPENKYEIVEVDEIGAVI